MASTSMNIAPMIANTHANSGKRCALNPAPTNIAIARIRIVPAKSRFSGAHVNGREAATIGNHRNSQSKSSSSSQSIVIVTAWFEDAAVPKLYDRHTCCEWIDCEFRKSFQAFKVKAIGWEFHLLLFASRDATFGAFGATHRTQAGTPKDR